MSTNLKKIALVPAPNVARSRKIRPYLPLGLLSLKNLSRPPLPNVSILYPPAELQEQSFQSVQQLAQELVSHISAGEFDVVGLSTMCSSFHICLAMAELLKQRQPHVQIWMGGPQASMVADELIEHFSCIDAIFVGEAEESFKQALERVAQGQNLDGLAGVRTRDSAFIPRESLNDIDDLPQIVFSPEDIEVIKTKRSKNSEFALPIEVARGCPGRCTFCSTRVFWGRKVRRKSNERVLAEMQRCASDVGLRRFEIIGDNFSASLRDLRSFCHALIEDSSDFLWMCDSRLDRLTEKELKLMWKAGCRGFFVGVESGSQKTLDRIKKSVDLDREIAVIKEAHKLGYMLKTSFIVGFPWETEQEVKQTFDLHCRFLREGITESQLWLLCPIPGTELARDHKYIFDRFSSRISMDGLPLDDRTRELMARHPTMFSQLGRYEAPELDPFVLTATVETAFQYNVLYNKENKEKKSKNT